MFTTEWPCPSSGSIYETTQDPACIEGKGVSWRFWQGAASLGTVAVRGGWGQRALSNSWQPRGSHFSRVNRVGETASSLAWLVISRPHFFRILHMATVFFCLGLFLHCEHKHLFDVPDIKYTVRSPSGQRKRDSCFWKLHWQEWQKAVWTADTKDGRERKGRDQSGVITILPSQQHTTGTVVLRVPGTAVNLLRARKEIDTATKGGPPLSMGFQFVLAEREPSSRQQCLYTHTSTFWLIFSRHFNFGIFASCFLYL